MSWILFLEPLTECAQSVRTRTDTTLDQDCVLKATAHVCTACMVVSLLTTCVHLNTPPLAQIAPFHARFASQTRKKARLPSRSVQASECGSVYHRSLVLEKRLLSLSHCHPRASLGSDWALKVVRQIGRSVRIHEISHCPPLLLCSLLLRCPCFAHCCHDPFIARSASNFSTFPRFHSVCASVSMFTINIDNCLFLFLFLC